MYILIIATLKNREYKGSMGLRTIKVNHGNTMTTVIIISVTQPKRALRKI